MKETLSHNDALMDLMRALKANESTATFFVTGKYYDKYPEIIDKMLEDGFEVGYHSHSHPKILYKNTLISEFELSGNFLKKVNPVGFRAPWIYLPKDLLQTVRDWGFKYDSSTFGSPGSFFVESGLNIFPVTSLQYGISENKAVYPKSANVKMLLKEFPIGSGIFVSLFRKIYKPLLEGFQRSNKPVVLYIHDWQLGESNGITYNLFRDKLRYTHRFPLLDTMLRLVEQFNFRSLDSILEVKNKNAEVPVPFAHYLTIDVENLGG